MSRFFRSTSDTSSDSDSSSSFSSSSEDEILQAKTQKSKWLKPDGDSKVVGITAVQRKDESDSEISSSYDSDSESESSSDSSQEKPTGKAKFARGAFSSDSESEEDVKRVVKSNKDKRFDEMRQIVSTIANGKKINDWVTISNEFDKLVKAVSKANTVIQKEGVPVFYTRALVQLEDFVKKTADSANVKKMNALNARAFNAMKQKIRKHNKTLESEIEAFKANPTADSDQSDQESRPPSTLPTTKEPKKKALDSESDSFPDDSDSSSESSSSDDSDRPKLTGRARWLKRPNKKGTYSSSSEEEKKKPVAKPKPQPKVVQVEEEDGEDGQFTTVGDRKQAAANAREAALMQQITADNLYQKLQETLEARGKKATDKTGQVRLFRRMLEVAQNPYQQVKVLLALVPAQFDYNPSNYSHLNVDTWKEVAKDTDTLLTILENTPTLTVRVTTEDAEDVDLEQRFKNGENVAIRGTVAALVDRLDDEFTRSLQNIDPHTTEYIERLRDENILYTLLVRAQLYYDKQVAEGKNGLPSGVYEELMEQAALATSRRLEHIYYKSDQVIASIEKSIRSNPSLKSVAVQDSEGLVHDLATKLYKQSNDRLRSRALLTHVYYQALHDRYHSARDMLLMSHLQENIAHADIPTQILYNRALVQLGLCAFRLGMIREAHVALQEILQSGKQKELLAQGYQQQRVKDDKAIEQERLEKLRQLPFHMHINVEMLEAVYLVCSMLLEVPNMAANKHDATKKIISRLFRKLLLYSERQVFVGPPENTRDHIMAASKALAMGEWTKARDFIRAIKVWDLMKDGNKIRDMLTAKIQEEALRTYLFSYGSHYDTLKLQELASMFSLDPRQVHVIVSKMVALDELAASLDEMTGTIIMQPGAEQTRLQYLAAAYGEKINQLVETNEKQLDLMTQMLGMAAVTTKKDDRKDKKPTRQQGNTARRQK